MGGMSLSKASTYTGLYKHRENGHISMLRVGFEPTIPISEQSKTVLPQTATGWVVTVRLFLD
jgi:hypothetical protein